MRVILNTHQIVEQCHNMPESVSAHMSVLEAFSNVHILEIRILSGTAIATHRPDSL